jgi:heme exporter protein A
MLTCLGVSVEIDEKIIFRNLSFSSMRGSVVCLLGENGSGKTSLLRVIAGIKKSYEGMVLLGGIDITELDKPYAGYVGHDLALKNEMTVLESISYWAALYNSDLMVPAAINYWGLGEIVESKILNLSAGNKKKVALARLMCCNCILWILDEAESNLDEQNKQLLQNLVITKANNGGIILMTSHKEPLIKKVSKVYLSDFYPS